MGSVAVCVEVEVIHRIFLSNVDVEAPPRWTPNQEVSLSAVASHGLIGEKRSPTAEWGKNGIGHRGHRTVGGLSRDGAVTKHHLRISRSPTRSRSRGMNAPCSRRTDPVPGHHPATLAKPGHARPNKPEVVSR
jgi:hypothetical protein